MTVQVLYEWKVQEFYKEECPDWFGWERLDHIPVIGEIITLHWLDGREAYKVKVAGVHLCNIQIDVEKVE